MTERLDGNALAGAAFAVFGREMTLATGVCGACGSTAVFAELHVYVGAGFVARCPACEAVLVRIVVGPRRFWLDTSVLATLQLDTGSAST